MTRKVKQPPSNTCRSILPCFEKPKKLAAHLGKRLRHPQTPLARHDRISEGKTADLVPVIRTLTSAGCFPRLPGSMLAKRALRLLGVRPESRICILPLLVEDKLTGACAGLGPPSIRSSDSPHLALFASQVASILQTPDPPMRSKPGGSMSWPVQDSRSWHYRRWRLSWKVPQALRRFSTRLEQNSKKWGWRASLAPWMTAGRDLRIKYLSIQWHRTSFCWAEKMAGAFAFDELSMLRRLSRPTGKVVSEEVSPTGIRDRMRARSTCSRSSPRACTRWP
ncbi:MAG: hypothetical protein MZV64_17470 [Ignavibacteriales bacterium]|nr:hypothetical protein [Ignavibacteriales bacterium]